MADDTQGIGDLVAQGSQPSTGAVDTSAATPQTPSQTPPTGPQPSTAPPTPAPQGTGAPAGAPQEQPNPNQPDAQKAPQQPSQPQKPATPTTSATDPAVEKASKVHTILQALTGGPHFATTVNPNTGTVERTQVPMSNAQFARGLAAAVLTGAFSGLEEKGPGAEGRAAGAGFNATLNQAKQQQAQEEREASETYGRQAAIANTNFQMHQTAQRMGQLDYEQHKQFVGDSADALKSINDVGAALATNVREEDLLPKYNITAVNAIPDGITKRLNTDGSQATDKYGQPLWDNTYTVVDPNKKIGLDQNTADFLAQHHVPGYFTMVDGKTVPKDFTGSPQVRAGIVVAGIAQASAIRTTEAQLNQQLAKLPKEGTQDAKVFEANLTKGLEDGSVSPNALRAFAPFATMPFDQALDEMRKSKADLASGGQLSGMIANLIPTDAQKALKKDRLDQEASDKSAREAAAAADKQKAELPGQIAQAKAKAGIATSNAYNEGYNHEAGSLAARVAAGVASDTLTGKLKNNDLYKAKADGPVVNGVNQAYLDQLKAVDPAIAAAVDAVGHGKAFVSNYGLAKDAGQHFLGLVHQAFPDFGVAQANEYEKQMVDFGINGKTGKANTAGSTLMEHLGRIHDAVSVGSTLGMSGKFDIDKANAINEMGNFYANGNKPGENELKDYRDPLGSKNPIKVLDAAKESAVEAMDKIKENYNTQARATPAAFGKPQPILSEDAANSYHKLTGKVAPDYLVDHSIKSRAYGDDNASTIKTTNSGQAARAPYPGQRPDEVPVFDPNDPNKLVGFTKPGKTGYRPAQQ